MARTPKDVTDTEVSILQVLWEKGCATVREVTERLYGGRSTSQNATSQKLLDRLEAKGYVSRDREAWPYTFKPLIEKEDLIGHQLRQTADKLCDGSMQPLLTHLVKTSKLTDEDRVALRALLDELNNETKKKKK